MPNLQLTLNPPTAFDWRRKVAHNFTLGEFFVTSHNQVLLRQEFIALPEAQRMDYLLNILMLAQRLQVIRDYYGKPITITSGWRSKRVNNAVGGASSSYHLTGMAADITVAGVPPAKVQADFRHWSGGLGQNINFTHLDIRPKREVFKY
jgi:uncharacterized protein YcbK (DUF882 family)